MFRRRALRRRLVAAGAPSLPDDQLRRLARALDAGATGGECVPAGHAASQLRLAVTRAFRFPDLRDSSELRRLPLCSDQQCCNPYHWSRLCKPGMCDVIRTLTRATSASSKHRCRTNLGLSVPMPCFERVRSYSLCEWMIKRMNENRFALKQVVYS
ncbi:hypothetical protein B5X24_HaOG205583 [Helicoverpa armigera]|uniref:MH1 domain-containing protein n=1 Tax=Helicoverpa armigera TaxID=29058 RepID=A0A2W1BLC4_HELAM|nr:hypothetical protein B5X24_HaOG205583 [Helicoverpa armigera]